MAQLEGPGSEERLSRLRNRFAGKRPRMSLISWFNAGIRKQGIRPIRFWGFLFGVLVVLACVIGSQIAG